MAAGLRRNVYKGIGEIHFIFGAGAETPTVQSVAALALRKQLVLHVDSPALDIHTLFGSHSKLRILWAHAGHQKPSAVGRMLSRYPTLRVDLSLRAKDIAPGGKLDPSWRGLFERYPDRFMIGSDTSS
ncbi:MAG: amidohydrolase, partial [Alphaproteobacteria bacterium]